MKRWRVLGVVLSLLLAGVFAIWVSFFLVDISNALDQSPTAATTFATVATAPVTEATTVPETVADTTAPTTEPTIETTEATQPETEPPTTEPTEPEPTETEPTVNPATGLSAKYAFVYDTAAGEYLYTLGGQYDQINIASITKLFSAWVALQIMPSDKVITAGEELTWIDEDSSRAWIYQGQKVTVTTCVQGMIIPSGNDAAYVLAVATGRELLGEPNAGAYVALDAFVAEMNARAQAQGLTGTHFTNPDGIDEEGHYSTPADVLKMAKLALSSATISRAAATTSMTAYYASGETANWTNSNHLLHEDSENYCPNAIGLKTGHTNEAGWCLVSAFDEGDRTLIIGVFGSETIELRNEDTLKLYEEFR